MEEFNNIQQESHGSENSEKNLVLELSLPLFQARVWMKLLGVMSIIGGALSALTIIGILWAWLPIWMGVLLFQAGTKIEMTQQLGNKFPFIESLNKLRLYFIISGVMVLVSIVIGIFWILVFGAAMFSAFDQYA